VRRRQRARRAPRWLAATLAVGLVGGGAVACTDPAPADPEAALVQTVQDTLDGAFDYRLVAEADREAVEELGQSLGSVAARLNVFEVTGVVDGSTASMDVQAFGTAPLLQVRRFGDDELYLRVAAGDGPLAALATPELEGRILGVAVQTGQSDAVVAAVGALFDGDWIGVTGAFDPGVLSELSGGQDAGDEDPDGQGDDQAATPLPQLVDDYIRVVDQQEDDGTTTTRVELQVRALLLALAGVGGPVDAEDFEENLQVIPETVAGDVLVADGVVEAVVFDIAAAAREAGDDVRGSLQLRLELSEHGQPTTPAVPDPKVTVPSVDLTEGLAQLLSTPPPGGGGASSPGAGTGPGEETDP